MVSSVPLPKKDREENEAKKNLVDENDEENNEPEDDLICVRLTEGTIKNIDLSENNNENNNNPLDFLGDNSNNNINTNNNNKEGNLDLLDLNNIFSSSGMDQANTNNTNTNTNNNNSMNPFDLLNLNLDQTNNTNNNNANNNSQPADNNNINDLLNMVMNTNNNNSNDNTNNTQTNNTIDLLSGMNTAPQQDTNAMKECFKNEDLSLYYNITKKEGSTIDGSVFASSHSNEEITDVKINFLVQKFVKLTVLDTSGHGLQPGQSLGIKKDFTLTSSDPSKKVVIKIKLHYSINKEEKTKELTIKNL